MACDFIKRVIKSVTGFKTICWLGLCFYFVMPNDTNGKIEYFFLTNISSFSCHFVSLLNTCIHRCVCIRLLDRIDLISCEKCSKCLFWTLHVPKQYRFDWIVLLNYSINYYQSLQNFLDRVAIVPTIKLIEGHAHIAILINITDSVFFLHKWGNANAYFNLIHEREQMNTMDPCIKN